MTIAPKYIDPLSDLGLKILFSPEDRPENLMALLNALLPPGRKIVKLRPLETEKVAATVRYKTVIYDLACEDERGRKFIIEVQRKLQLLLRRRLVHYGARQVSRSVVRGEDGYDYPDVVVVAILDHAESGVTEPIYHAGLRRDDGELWSSALAFTVVNLGNFRKPADRLDTEADAWLYLLRNLPTMTEVPTALQTPTFDRFLSDAEYAQLSDRDKDLYFAYWDEVTTRRLEEAAAEQQQRERELQATEQGIEQENARMTVRVVLRAHAMGLSEEVIADLAEASVARVREIIAAHGEGA